MSTFVKLKDVTCKGRHD